MVTAYVPGASVDCVQSCVGWDGHMASLSLPGNDLEHSLSIMLLVPNSIILAGLVGSEMRRLAHTPSPLSASGADGSASHTLGQFCTPPICGVRRGPAVPSLEFVPCSYLGLVCKRAEACGQTPENLHVATVLCPGAFRLTSDSTVLSNPPCMC